MNTLNFRIKFFLFCSIIEIYFIQDVYSQGIKNRKEIISYADSTFLEIKGDLYEPKVIWENEAIYLRALHRMEQLLFLENERLCWNIKNGVEIKISENIFQYIVDAWQNQNKMVESGNFGIVLEGGRYVVRSKKVLEEETEKLTGKAPEFKLPDMEGNIVKLSDYKSKYVLVDFWASWYRPCRIKSKKLKEKHSRLKELGIEVIGISCDENKVQWLKAIEEDQSTWIQLRIDEEINGSDTADDYKVEFIPTLYLISPEGVVLSKNPNLDAIETWVQDSIINY